MMRPSLIGGQGGGSFICSRLNVKYGCFVFLGVGHAPVGIQPIFMPFVTISSSLMSLFQGHEACQNFTLTCPQSLVAHNFTGVGLHPSVRGAVK